MKIFVVGIEEKLHNIEQLQPTERSPERVSIPGFVSQLGVEFLQSCDTTESRVESTPIPPTSAMESKYQASK